MSINTRGAIAHLQWNRWEDIEISYDILKPVAPHVPVTDNHNNVFSFTLNNWVYFYVEMYRLSTSTRWLDLAEDACLHFIANNDEARFARGDIVLSGSTLGVDRYWQAPYPYTNDGVPVPGWSSSDGCPGLRVQILQDGQILGAMANYADYILSNNITAYVANANIIFAHIKLVIDSHENSWRNDKVSTSQGITLKGNWYYPDRIDGSNYVYSGILAYNHCAGAAQAALLYHKHFTNADYLDKAERFMDFIRTTRTDLGDMYFWKYIVSATKSEDVNHGSYTLTFFMAAVIGGYLSFTEEELTKYAGALVNTWQGTKVGDMSEKFDGTGVMPDGEAFDGSHLADFTDYNPDVYKVVQEAHATRSKDYGFYGRMYRGAATLLRYKQVGSLFA